MSAQPLPTSAVNGVAPSGQDPPRRVDSQDPPTEGSALNNTSGNRAYGTSGTTASGAMGDPPSGVQTSDLGAIGVPTSGPSAEDAAAAAEQATQQQHSTILEAGGALQNGISGAGTEQGNVQMGFVTPRSRISQGDWMAALEMPRWMSRLGSYLNLARADTAPSPLAGPGRNSPPPGGRAFILRSPPRGQRMARPTTTPSSSSLPAEAIEAEVQRQLGGLFGYNRLKRGMQCWRMRLR